MELKQRADLVAAYRAEMKQARLGMGQRPIGIAPRLPREGGYLNDDQVRVGAEAERQQPGMYRRAFRMNAFDNRSLSAVQADNARMRRSELNSTPPLVLKPQYRRRRF